MYLTSLKISKKLKIGATIFVLFIVFLGGIGFYYLDRSHRSVDHIVKNNHGRIIAFK